MNLSLKTKNFLFFITVLLIAIVNFSTMLMTEESSAVKEYWVDHTYEVIHESSALLAALTDAETGQRGYLVSLSKDYLAPFHYGKQYTFIHLETLQQLTADNVIQQQRLKTLRELIEQKFAELQKTIDLTKEGRIEKSLQVVNSHLGKQLMDKIRILLEEFKQEEEALLRKRKSDFDNEKKYIRQWYLFMLIVMIVLVIMIGIFIQKKIISPLVYLTESAIKQDKKEQLATSNNNEITQLTNAFHQMNSDIHERTDKIIENEKVLQQLVHEKTQALAAAENADKAKTVFLSSMSHELRTPLNAILGFSQLLEMKVSDELLLQNVKEINAAGKDLLNLVNDIFEFTKIGIECIELTQTKFELMSMIEECISITLPLAKQYGIQINPIEKGNNFILLADKDRLKKVILNLISNAIKYNREKGQVSIAVFKQDNTKIRIAVADTGHGIKENDIDKLFAPFNRLNKGNCNIKGVGIGLVIAKSLVELMGGKIDFNSKEGKGSTFYIDMPTHENYEEKNEIISNDDKTVMG